MLPKSEVFNDLNFTTSDLFRLTEIEDSEYKTDNEKFLIGLIEKFFFRVASMQDDINNMKEVMEQA